MTQNIESYGGRSRRRGGGGFGYGDGAMKTLAIVLGLMMLANGVVMLEARLGGIPQSRA